MKKLSLFFGLILWLSCLPGIANSSLVGYWKFNESSGTIVYDRSSSGQNGTLAGTVGTPTWNAYGKFGFCLDFDPTDIQYILVEEDPGGVTNPLNKISVCTWIRFDDGTNVKTIIYRKGSYCLRVTAGEAPSFNVYTTSWDNADGDVSSMVVNTWYFVVGTFDGTTIQVFLNGNLVASETHSNPGNTVQTQYHLYIGRWSTATDPFAGKLDEIRIYDNILTSSEVLILYKNGRIGWNTSSWGQKSWRTVPWKVIPWE